MVAASSEIVTAPVKEGEVLAAKYRVEKVIGFGGMGVVVSAMHLELDKRVALKFLLPQAAASDELIGRFMREAKASVKLKGSHVAQTLDVGRMDDGRSYIVMEYLDGRDLGQEIKAHAHEPFDVADAVGWILQACEGLAEAHALGIVHRDLKPANLFLSHTDTTRRFVKVLDFGISKSINPSSSDHLSLTKTEMLLGSPLYMAPEQMRSSKYVDERSDIWSLGAIAYELLTGHVPFEADTLLDLCFRVAQEDCASLIEVRSDLPIALSDAIMRCLDKDPEKRWKDVGELARALEPFADESDKGSAERTIATLQAGDPKARPRGESYVPTPVTDITRPKTIARSGTRTVVQQDEQVITGSSPTERAPDQDDREGGNAARIDPALHNPALHDTAPHEAIPSSRALGVSQSVEPRSNTRIIFAILALGLAVLLVSFVLSRRASTPAAPPPPAPVAIPTIVTPPEPPLAAPAPAPETHPETHEDPPVVAAPSTTTARPRPRPRPTAAPSAKPVDSGGFLKVRE